MPFNTTDTTKAPYTGECMTLTNEEVISVQDECAKVNETFTPDDFTPVLTDSWTIARYNESNNYQEAINGATYDVVKVYERDFNTQGIDINGIIPEPQPEEPEQTEEETTDENAAAPISDSEGETAPEGEEIPEENTQPEVAPEEVTEETTQTE
jgi:hypothetical protein